MCVCACMCVKAPRDIWRLVWHFQLQHLWSELCCIWMTPYPPWIYNAPRTLSFFPLSRWHMSSHAKLNWVNLSRQRTWFVAVLAGALSSITVKDKFRRCTLYDMHNDDVMIHLTLTNFTWQQRKQGDTSWTEAIIQDDLYTSTSRAMYD